MVYHESIANMENNVGKLWQKYYQIEYCPGSTIGIYPVMVDYCPLLWSAN
jgi:hypothetical protein